MSWIVNTTKPDFLGKRGLLRSDSAREGRKQLVGLLTVDAQTVLVEGSQVIRKADAARVAASARAHDRSCHFELPESKRWAARSPWR